MSDTIKHSPELAAACQYVNDLRIKKALQESSMLVLLTEEFSSSDFTELVQSIADVGKLLPKEMQNSRKAFQTAVKSALKTKVKLNRGSVTKEQFAREVAQLAGLGSALTSVVTDLKNIALLRDATSMQQEADADDKTLGNVLGDEEQDLVMSAIEDSFKPQGLWNNIWKKKREWYGLTDEGLFDDLMNVTLNGLGKLMQSNEIPSAFKDAMSPEDAEVVANEVKTDNAADSESDSTDGDDDVAQDDIKSDEEEEVDDEPATDGKVNLVGTMFKYKDPDDPSKGAEFRDESWKEVVQAVVDKPNTKNRRRFTSLMNAVVDRELFESRQHTALESAHSGKDKIILERWRKMAGICKDRE